MQIGFVGLGRMGGTMARVLGARRNQFAGHAVKKSGT